MRQAIPPHADYELDYFTASPASAPLSIEGMYDSVVSAAACLVELEPCLEEYDGVCIYCLTQFVVACFSAHPLCHVLREKTTAPVMSILSAPLLLASTLGGKISILTTSPRWVPLLEHDVQSLGLSSLCHRIASSGLRVLELESLPRKQVLQTLGRIAREDLVEREGSDVIVLGCAGMAGLEEAVREQCGPGVVVLDPVRCGVEMCVAAWRLGASTAKAGLYAPP